MDSEAGHYYARDGSPAYFTNGRGTTLRDARKLNLVPSVTTVLNVIAKPALTNWLVDQGIMAALTMPRIDGEDERTYIARIKTDSKAQAKSAAEEGSRIHDAIEQSFRGGSFDPKYEQHVAAAHAELKRLYPEVDDWIAEKSFAHPLGFGGKVDLHSPSTGIVHDWKTKDGDFSDGKKLAYDQNVQLAAYQVGLDLCDDGNGALCKSGYIHKQCGNSFVSRTHPGAISSVVWTTEQIASGWRIFELALALCKETSGYDGGW